MAMEEPLLTLNPPVSITLKPEPLSPPAFAPFGYAITSPLPQEVHSIPDRLPAPPYPDQQCSPVRANQGTALKYPYISRLLNCYPGRSRAHMSMFSCFPRQGLEDAIFPIRILERHPYTTQTFTPLGLAANDMSARYLVIVAPSLDTPATPTSPANPPDLGKVHAFIARGGQAVTYAVGTWHAPMVVLGANRIDFVVMQFVSGYPEEDCQEVLVGEGIGVNVQGLGSTGEDVLRGPGKKL